MRPVLFALCLAACSRAPSAPRPEAPRAPSLSPHSIATEVAEGDVLAYKVVSVSQQEGRPEARREAVLYVERRGTELIAHGFESGPVPEALARRWWLPSPSDPAEWVVPGEGRTSNVVRADFVVQDEHEVTEGDEGLVVVTTRVARFALLGEMRCRYEGLFDPAHERYIRMRSECSTSLDTSGSGLSGRAMEARGRSRFEASFDEEAAALRRASLARYPTLRSEARDGLDAYLAAHPVESEITRALDAGNLPLFYTRSHAAEVWTAVLDNDRYHPLFPRLTMPYFLGGLPDEVVPVLLARLDDPDVARFVAGSTDPELRAAVERLAAGEAGVLRERAAETLLTASRQPADLRGMALNELAMYGTRMLAVAPPERYVPVLIDILAEAPDGPRSAIVVQWLEALTLRSHGRDVAAWQGFWTEHHDRPHRAWCLDAAESSVPLLRAAAFRSLAAQDPGDPARALLTTALADPAEGVRDAAARTLLVWGDRAAFAHALRALDSFSLARRRVGFDMLTYFGEHALGYAPDAPEEERVAAIARWRAWAARRP
ncbi:MAG: hypothetical protein AB8I08_03105 [Sandaracinaceae bacterium]